MKWETHIMKEKIHTYMEGDLSDSETDQLWAELLGRPDELDYLQTLATLKKMGQDGKFDFEDDHNYNILPLISERALDKVSHYKKYLVAASALILGMAILFQINSPIDGVTDYSPIASIEYEIERSADVSTVFDTHLQNAVSLSATGNINAALNELNEASNLHLTENQIVDMHMVEGAIYYNASLFNEAVATFSMISSKDHLDSQNLEKSLWYLANAQLHLNKIDEAKVNIEKVITLDGAFSRIARQKLNKL